MVQITKLEVSFEQRLQDPANQYDFKRAAAIIGYVAEDGEDVNVTAALQAAFDAAIAAVQGNIGYTKVSGSQPLLDDPKFKSDTKQKLEAAAALNAKDEAPAKKRGRPKKSAAVIEDETDTPEEEAPASPAPVEATDDDDIIPVKKKKVAAPAETEGTDEPAEITDGTLNLAVSATVKRLVNSGVADGAQLVKQLLAKYQPAGAKVFTLRQLEQADRATFIRELESLGEDQ